MSSVLAPFLNLRGLGGVPLIGLPQPGLDEILEEAHKGAQINDQRGDQAGDLGAVDLQIHVAAACGDVLDEERGQDGTQGTQAAQERHGDAVEAHAGDGGNGGLPVLDAGEVQ